MATFGLTTVGASNNNVGSPFCIVQEDVTGNAGTLDDVQLYSGAASGTKNVKGFVYDNFVGGTANLVGVSGDVSNNTTDQWRTYTISGSPTINASSTYSVGFNGYASGQLTVYYDSVAGTRWVGTNNSTPIDPWTPSSGSFTGRRYSFYANYTESGADTDVNATLDTLSITDFDTTVTALVDLNISATLDTLSITDLDSTVTALNDVNINITLDALNISDLNTTVEALINTSISATLDTLSITDLNTTVQAGVDVNINATLDTLTITNFSTTVQALVDKNINATLDSLSIADLNASIAHNIGLNVLTTTDNLTITNFNTTIEALVSTLINASLDTLSIVDLAATVYSGVPIVLEGVGVSVTLSDTVGINSSIKDKVGITVTITDNAGVNSSIN